jgi:hypothetical protein
MRFGWPGLAVEREWDSQDGSRRKAHGFFRYAAQEDVGQARAAVRPHNDQIRLLAPRFSQDFPARIALDQTRLDGELPAA